MLGVAAQEFAEEKNEVNLSDAFGTPNRDTLNPSVGWIRTPNAKDTGAPTKGYMLAAYTRQNQAASTGLIDSDAVWAVSTNWTTSTGTYTETRANEWYLQDPSDPFTGRHRWPPPSNLCPYYPASGECGGGGANWNTESLAHWHEPAASLWTGLDRTAAIVTTGGSGSSSQNQDVFVVTSNDGGQTFQRSLVVSIEEGGPDTLPEFDTEIVTMSGGAIVSGSVHASLANFGERTSTLAGRVSIPLYVVWQNRESYYVDPEWWWTRVEVGESGYIAQTTPPQRLPKHVPRDPGTQVSIFGYRIDGEERVAIAWGERADGAAPNPCTSANTNKAVGWKAMTTEDLGETWGCFMGNEPTVPLPGGGSVPYFDGCDGEVTTIRTVTNWPTCARVHATSPMPNSVRPEIAINAPAAAGGNGIEEDVVHRYWYVALTEPMDTSPSTQWSRVCVHRTGSVDANVPSSPAQDHDRFLQVACTPSADPSGRDVGQAYAPALAVAQGTTDRPRVELSYRSLVRSPEVARQNVMSIDWALFPSQTPTPDNDHLAFADSPLGVGQWGTRSGIAAYEKCISGGCPSDGNFPSATGADVGFASAWSDTRRSLSPRVTDTFIRTFEWE